jgi:transposase-like protein
MSAEEKSEILTRVEETRWGKRRLLSQLQVPKSTYYRWRARALQGKQDSSTDTTRVP